MKARESLRDGSATVCILGLGYVGLPLALGFANSGLKVRGFDINKEKVETLSKGMDTNNDISREELEGAISTGNITFTSDEKDIKGSDFFIISVPTPLRKGNEPDLAYVESAGSVAGRAAEKGAVIVLESTVYPGVTRNILGPAVEKASGMKAGTDFFLGYSPERINPGDREHTLKKIVKVVGGQDKETTDVLAELYGKVTEAGTHKTDSIETAEAAKVIENIQRDLNIALVNELALIFGKMGIDVNKVLEAAGTKWNFHPYRPGLVGGHCIPVDPYYLVHKAKDMGYDSKVILAGRDINNYMPMHVVSIISASLNEVKKSMNGSNVLLLGLTFKKNVKDYRNTPAEAITKELLSKGVNVFAYEPHLKKEDIEKQFGIRRIESMDEAKEMDCVVLVTDHDAFRAMDMSSVKSASSQNPILVDVRRFFDASRAKELGIRYKTL